MNICRKLVVLLTITISVIGSYDFGRCEVAEL